MKLRKNIKYLGTSVFFGLLGFFQNCAPVNFSKDANSTCTISGCLSNVNGTGIQISQDFSFNGANNKVDILFVDDNSGSMSAKQQNLGSRLDTFVASISGLDWQIGVTTTDVTNSGARGQFIGPQGQVPVVSNSYMITPSTPNYSQIFLQTIQRNAETGSGDERGIYAANMVIDNRSSSTQGFFRNSSNLAVIILSDEDERSVGGDPALSSDPQFEPLEPYDQPQTLIDKVRAAFGDKPLLVNAIIAIPGDSACLAQSASHYGKIYAQAVAATGGVMGSICSNDYTPYLNNIGGAIVNQSKNINLDHIPVSAPVVTWSPPGNAVSYTWTPGTGSIVLSSYPISGTTMHVTYSY